MLDIQNIEAILSNFWKYLYKIYDKMMDIEKETKEIKRRMATQDERLKAVLATIGRVQSGVDNIQDQLAKLKAGNPDLEADISAIEASVSALGADVDSSVEPPTA